MKTTLSTPFVMTTGLKSTIQTDLLALVPKTTIGPQGERSSVFAELNKAILSRHLSLYFLDGSTAAGNDGGLRLAIGELTRAAEQFYAKRTDNLCVKDYVTDFPDIAKLCHYLLARKAS